MGPVACLHRLQVNEDTRLQTDLRLGQVPSFRPGLVDAVIQQHLSLPDDSLPARNLSVASRRMACDELIPRRAHRKFSRDRGVLKIVLVAR